MFKKFAQFAATRVFTAVASGAGGAAMAAGVSAAEAKAAAMILMAFGLDYIMRRFIGEETDAS